MKLWSLALLVLSCVDPGWSYVSLLRPSRRPVVSLGRHSPGVALCATLERRNGNAHPRDDDDDDDDDDESPFEAAYTYTSAAERQLKLNEQLQAKMGTDELKRRLILDAAQELQQELSNASEELAEARDIKLSAAQLIDEGRLQAEKQWRPAVEELEKSASELGSELASLRREQSTFREEATRDREILQRALEQVKVQLDAQQVIVANERDRADSLDVKVSELRAKMEIAERGFSLERLELQREIHARDLTIQNQTAELDDLRDQLTCSKTLAKLLVKAWCGENNRSAIAKRVKNRLVIFNKVAAICACGSIIALAPILGPKLALTVGSISIV